MRTASLLLIVILVACDLDSDTEVDKYTVTDSSGVRIVESQHPIWDSASVVIESDPLVQIGQEVNGPYLFSSVRFGLLLSNDDVAVVDNAALEVRTFDSTGRHLASFGGGGEGPGEFVTSPRSQSIGAIHSPFTIRGFVGRPCSPDPPVPIVRSPCNWRGTTTCLAP